MTDSLKGELMTESSSVLSYGSRQTWGHTHNLRPQMGKPEPLLELVRSPRDQSRQDSRRRNVKSAPSGTHGSSDYSQVDAKFSRLTLSPGTTLIEK